MLLFLGAPLESRIGANERDWRGGEKKRRQD